MLGNPYDPDCPTRALLDRIGDQWTVLIVGVLGDGPLRFTEIGKRVRGISQKVLTQTLRSLVRDGILTRTAYPEIPPHVEYELTDLGRNLAEPLDMLDKWARVHMGEVLDARKSYDGASLSRADGNVSQGTGAQAPRAAV
ncbi:winged helix-turn-helix transcriptional regulator [Amycolatopsis regifaucium]|uniref:Transcriptional regulator n=1 Tax=Amycolatopsis regifaucium TaxID=546365 RepID=A0A154MI11_9PSEU|nr:helix-turn-helix domain-containing protein [Amycolatopsis regifaucium]KZB83637.1 HxlR family transcriptional regulator [Amycolatopsis regifaucium]OKA03845.1 transcriptional regulator [Amycolatopsis regifaucium]SFJ66367.1 DNA-binding transcriptional regulator, HxlR family [Amycolatopsis regifaucium]